VPEIPAELLDQFVTGPMTAESVEAVMRKFKKAILERALGAEMTHHLGIALVQLASGNSTWFTKSMGPTTAPPSWLDIPEFVGWWCDGDRMSVISRSEGKFARAAHGFSAREAE
jgi:hypothetical protein